ncbi:MAG: hypothetical protein ABGZ35_17270 [Planctomycetaceae bacterium]|jgi:predicted PurR-regulated permease PerM
MFLARSLATCGTFVVSLSDNFIKAYVICDRSQTPPFVVFVAVLGALHFVGPWGIFSGPVTAADNKQSLPLINVVRK